jgi:hypothetical protein
LEKEYTDFQNLSDRIIVLSKDYFKKVMDNDDICNNKMRYDLSCVYIAEIQNLYLNPINYRLNKLNSDKSLKKANHSINLGKWSIGIGLVMGIGGFVWNYCNSTP